MSSETRPPSRAFRVALPGAGALALMLAALSMLGPFSVDTYLPAFPSMQVALQASPIEVQQTLTAYMFSFAVMILWHGALSDAFIDGAREGFATAVRIIPYLVAMLVGIAVLRASGALDLLLNAIRSVVAVIGWDTRFVDGVPTEPKYTAST